MRKIAVYRIHYGLDFLGKSIESLYLHVDKIFVFWSKQPWYKECKNLPPLNENVEEFCNKYEGWGDNKVTVFQREYDLPENQFKKMYDEICQYYPRPDQALFMEPDMVWDHKTLNEVWKLKDDEVSFDQIEQYKKLCESIDKNGMTHPIIVAHDMRVLRGNQRVWYCIDNNIQAIGAYKIHEQDIDKYIQKTYINKNDYPL